MIRSTGAALATVLLLAVPGLAGCGHGSAPSGLALTGVPLAAHTRVIATARRCDGGAHPFCARMLVLSAARTATYTSSGALLAAEAAKLRRAGWSIAEGDTDYESAAESPGNRLRLTYATAAADLRSVEEHRIVRAANIARALSGRMFARVPALSLMLQAGSS